MPRVTSASSVWPQPLTTASSGHRCVACRTMAGGMGAPKQQNRVSDETSRASMFGAFRVSCRKGVAAEVQVIRCFSISSTNRSLFQTSW